METSWKTVRVFISSTFRDMQAERDHLVRFVFPRLKEELLKHRIHLVDVDLRWGVTGGEDASEVCREVIGECRPRFLCILGGRYGHVPDKAKKSITADEIEYGVLNPPANDHGPVRAFFYFRHEAATARMVEEKLGDFREPTAALADKLTKLKQTIAAAGHEPRIYGEDAQWDAAAKRLVRLTKFGDSVHDDLLQSIKTDPKLAERFTTTAAPPDEFADENDAMESFIEERTERFIPGSRQKLLNALAAFATTDDAQNIRILTGAPGSGKSALLARLVRDLDGKVPVIPHFIGASSGSTDLRRTLRRLCHELAPAEPLPEDLKELTNYFQTLLRKAESPVVLIFDALNQLDTTDGAHWLNWLPREIPPHIRIIASVIAPADGQPEHQTLAILRVRPGIRIEPLGPLDESDARAIIESFRVRYKKRLSPGQIAVLLDEKKPERFLPLYLLTALEELRTLGTDEQITTLAPGLFSPSELARLRRDDHDQILAVFIEKILPGTARELFQWILTKRLGTDPILSSHRHGGAAGLVEKFAACLGVSRHGLSPAELTALLDPGDPLGNVAALLRLLRPYLMRRGELLDFYHGQFREAVQQIYLHSEKQRSGVHEQLAHYFRGMADPDGDGTWNAASLRPLNELPWHALHSISHPCKGILGSLLFCAAKARRGAVFDLIGDFLALFSSQLPSSDLRQVFHILQINAPRLSRYPECALQQLLMGVTAFTNPAPEILSQSVEIYRDASRRGIKLQPVIPEHRPRGVTALPKAEARDKPLACLFRDGVLVRNANGAWREYSAGLELRTSGAGSSSSANMLISCGNCIATVGSANVVVRSPWPSGEPLLYAAPGNIVAAAMSGATMALATASGTVLILRLSDEAIEECAEFQTEGKPLALSATDGGAYRLANSDGLTFHLKCDSTMESRRSDFPGTARLASIGPTGGALFADEKGTLFCTDPVGRVRWQAQPASSPRSMVSIHRANGEFAVGFQDGSVSFFDAETGNLASTCQASLSAIMQIAWHPESEFFLCGDAEGNFFMLRLEQDAELETHPLPPSIQPISGRWNVATSTLEIIGGDGSRYLFSAGLEAKKLGDIPGPIRAAQMLRDGRFIFIQRDGQVSRLFESEISPVGERVVKELWNGDGTGPLFVDTFGASPCGNHIFMSSAGAEAGLGLMSFTKRGWLGFHPSWRRSEADIGEVAISGGGQVMIITQARGTAATRRPARVLVSGRYRHAFLDSGWGGGVAGIERGSARYLMGTSISHDGRLVAAVDAERRLNFFIFDPTKPSIPPQLVGAWQPAATCELFPSGRGCVVLQPDGAVRILDLADPANPRIHATALPPWQISCSVHDETERVVLLAASGFIQLLKYEPLP